MGAEDPSGGIPDSESRPDAPSVLVVASGRAEADTVERALSRHGLEVTVEFDAGEVIETGGRAADCLLVPDSAPVTPGAFLDALGEDASAVPVVFLLEDPDSDLRSRLADVEAADYVDGDVEAVSYDRLADRIRAVVADYRASRARRSERDVVARLEEQIHQTERKITALHSVAMDLNSVSTFDAVYEETVEAAERILDLDICFAFEAHDERFVPKARSSTPTDEPLESVPIDAGVMGETYRTGESDRVVDMELHALAAPAFGDYQSGISVPIGSFGVFQAVAEEPGAFDRIDLELAELLMAHAAAALQRIQFEADLRVERDRYAALYENSADCILEAAFDADGDPVIRGVNPTFEAVFGYDEADIVGRDPDEVIASEDRRADARELTERVRNGEVVQAEVRRQTTDGLRDFLLRSVPVDDDALYAVYTDITAQKDTQRTIEQQRERLDAFASTLSHDLRSPLSVATGRLELAREDRDSEDLQAVANALDRIESLITDILTVAREGDRAMDSEPVRLATVVEDCWSTVETGGATLAVETDRVIEADEGRLQQLVENLLRNAVDHGGRAVAITVGDLDDGFYVADDGPGIPEDERTEVFDAGYSTAAEGTGLGLSIVEGVADAHGWTVSATDSQGGGTRIEVTGVTVVDEPGP